MGITTSCVTDFANLGSQDCDKNNPFLDLVSLIFTKDDFEFATRADFADQTKWDAGIRAKAVFPLHDIVEMEDQSEDSQYYESPTGSRIPRRLGKYRHTYKFNKGLEEHKAIQTMRNAKLRVFTVDSAGNVNGYSPDGIKVQGMSIGMINPEKMTTPMQDNTPAWTPIAVDLRDAKQWNEKGISLAPSWYATELAAVSDVELSVITKTAILIVLKVAYYAGLNNDGSDNLIGIAGILEDDFVFTDTAPTSYVDNGDGTYDFIGVGMTSGSVTLKTPALATTTGDPIESTGPAVITIP